MNPTRLAYLASRAAAGLLTLSEQREVMELVHVLAKDCTLFSGRPSFYMQLAAAAKLPPVRKRCERCNGEGTAGIRFDTIAGLQIQRVCHDCSGTGYVEAKE